ncbi:hypothetical protein HHK36_019124 [Tetracentron sinense]|uniref:DEAD-box ATP-dependent RNA helicase 33 n=1 Tax=Tetracentron sinense TaxID=13715 RepID=A0A834Z1P1_TETSI|nr:hypothetical protein HHK36_019124 [Tetracentron sinense]
MSLLIPTSSQNFSSLRVFTGSDQPCLLSRISQLSIHTVSFPATKTIIRMGGGPRTFPGGVSKWQWKRMQANKAKQLLKARLCRERQIYEMRKRAELKAAVSELEKPWEVVERAPILFSVRADEQLKVLADRFQRPGGYDLWSERDGPQLFQTADGFPSARFFPKGVVHSIKPYGSIADSHNPDDANAEDSNSRNSTPEARTGGLMGRGRNRLKKSRSSSKQRLIGRSDIEGEAGRNGLVSRKDSWVEENSYYSKNSWDLGSREDGVASFEASDSVDRRQMSGDFYGGGAGNGSFRGGLKNKGNRQRFGLTDSYGVNPGRVTTDTEGKGEAPLVHHDRYKGSGRRFNTEKGSRRSKSSHSEEIYNMSLQQDGSYGFPN